MLTKTYKVDKTIECLNKSSTSKVRLQFYFTLH